MTYLYQCEKCKTETEIVKPMSECSKVECCKNCNIEMKRVYQAGMIKTGDGVKH